ncbi:MAG: nucleoside hydrolase [Coriobacteriales bacterium]|jgi:purine nucleosidase|nr:nucleoside hydrolase [Coriobacteriales bacterium]
MNSKRIIFDFDNTMGVKGCDVDDGLALLYVLGHPELARVEALCTSFGNNTQETTFANTQRIARDLSLDIPVLRGAEAPGQVHSDAAEYLAAVAAASPGELTLVATGSLTNLWGAQQIAPDFFANLKELSLMGGITQSLVFNGRIMDELNWHSDPVAAYAVLESANRGTRVSTATGNNCLPAHFTLAGFQQHFAASPGGSYFLDTCSYWFEDMRAAYGLDGFCCWDVLASAFVITPELFARELYALTLNQTFLSTGYLEPAFEGAPQATIGLLKILDPATFCEQMYQGWCRALALRV